MATEIISNPARVWEFVSGYIPVPVVSGMKGIGLLRNGVMQAGVLYEGFNGRNVWMHVAAAPGGKWMTREFLRYAFHYPFVEMGVERVSGAVDASNKQAQKLDEHLGFVEETRLNGAAADGGDVILYVMWKKDCRHVDPQ